MQAYDQRYVRHTPDGFRLARAAAQICEVCGFAERCDALRGLNFLRTSRGIETSVEVCPEFMPVITFQDDTGLDALFNTFRRGAGWFNRARVGTRVRFFSTELEAFVGEGRVVETYQAELGELLEHHASMNHLLRDGLYSDAPERLQKILERLYGKNYAQSDKVYSVIYVEPKSCL